MDFVITDRERMETGYLDGADLDLDIGNTNDFEVTVGGDEVIVYGGYFFVPGTEYGGEINRIHTDTTEETSTYGGRTWRGMLDTIIVSPDTGEDYKVFSGEANNIIARVLGSGPGLLFSVPQDESGIEIAEVKFRYESALSGLSKMLETHGAKLKICALRGGSGEPFSLTVQAVPIEDYSEEIEYDGSNRISMVLEEYRGGINHLICLGRGDLREREVIHLYVQEDGSIGKRQHYTGEEERTAVYDYSSVESTSELEKGGIERLKELMNYKKASITVEDIDLGIGDIVGAKDRSTGIKVAKPIVGKIVRVQEGTETMEYKLEGEET